MHLYYIKLFSGMNVGSKKFKDLCLKSKKYIYVHNGDTTFADFMNRYFILGDRVPIKYVYESMT